MYKRYLLINSDMGIYIGSCLGLGFWSKLDPIGQPCAGVFESWLEANTYIQSWDSPINEWSLKEIYTKDPNYASIEEIENVGLETWEVSKDL